MKMDFPTRFLCVSLFFYFCESHVCLLSPPQRGSMVGLNEPASPDCILLTSPCGGRSAPQFPALALRSGSNFTVTFQKNLDHWMKATPGYFSVSIEAGAEGEGGPFKEIARIPDMGEPSLHLYSVNITLPIFAHTSASPRVATQRVMQVMYTTKNSAAPPAFYQCADFLLI